MGILSFRNSRSHSHHSHHHDDVGTILTGGFDMRTPASFRNHPIHPVLVAFPIALWIFSLVSDGIYYLVSRNLFWKDVAFYSIAGGIVGALLAAIPGLIDYVSLTDRRLKNIATTHMIINLFVVALFAFNLGMRYNASPESGKFAVALSLLAIFFMGISGWLGGSLVYEHRVGVSEPREEREIDRHVA
jgi:uncharacterized membrane protein